MTKRDKSFNCVCVLMCLVYIVEFIGVHLDWWHSDSSLSTMKWVVSTFIFLWSIADLWMGDNVQKLSKIYWIWPLILVGLGIITEILVVSGMPAPLTVKIEKAIETWMIPLLGFLIVFIKKIGDANKSELKRWQKWTVTGVYIILIVATINQGVCDFFAVI